MRDPLLKRLFGHAEVVEILIRDMLPEDAGRIDFATLEKVGTELVGEALVRRYPDMLWTARTRDGTRRVLISAGVPGPTGSIHAPSDDDLLPPGARGATAANAPRAQSRLHRCAAAHGDLPRTRCMDCP